MQYPVIITYENGVKAVVKVNAEDRDEASIKAKSLATRPYRSISVPEIEKPAPSLQMIGSSLSFQERLQMAFQSMLQ